MKKINFMRVASFLLVFALLTTCGIGGTFAKYVTEASGSDTARVAKWGVVLTAAADSNFDYKYDEGNNGAYSVHASANAAEEGTEITYDALVAPGTKDATGIKFSIKGTPEVATKVDIVMTITSDVVLASGTYFDWTTSDKTTDTFTTTADYYPVVFTLSQTGKIEPVATGNLATIKAALDAYTATATYLPNTTLDAEFTLTWEWVFEGAGDDAAAKALVDKQDTLLGNIAAQSKEDGATNFLALPVAENEEAKNMTSVSAADFITGEIGDGKGDYSTNISYTIKFTVTQVDADPTDYVGKPATPTEP